MNQQGVNRRGGCVKKRGLEQVKGIVKGYNGKDGNPGNSGSGISGRRLRRIKSDSSGDDDKKGKDLISPELGNSPIQLRKTLSEPVRMATISGENWEEAGGIGEEDGVDIEVDVERKGADDDKEVELEKEDLEPEIDVEEEDKRIDQIHEVPISSNADKTSPDVLDCQQIVDPSIIKSPPTPIKAKVGNESYEESIREKQNKIQMNIIQFRKHQVTSNSKSPPTPMMAEVEDESSDESIYENKNRIQMNIVDLVMWREASRSALVFGTGTFLLISSSYTKDLNFSLISAISYLGLFYLAMIFLYKFIINRGAVDFEDCSSKENLLIREEDASRLICILLPYINEVLINIKALFSGDPSTTMKMAMALFVLARCGGSITIWTMAKLVFFGVFTVPRLLSSYSDHIQLYGKFVLERSRDAWDSCTHKKAAAFATFAVMWNLSSPAARTWVVFMMLVAARYYQQQMAATGSIDDNGEDDVSPEDQNRSFSQKVTVFEVNQKQSIRLVDPAKGKEM